MFSLALIKVTTFFAAFNTPCASPNKFFFLPTWWEYLPHTTDALGKCVPTLNDASGNFKLMSILLIGLAIIDMLLRVAGLVAVLSIVAAGFQHVFSGGNPEKAASARRRIYNSLIGLAIAMTATAIVTYIGNQLGA